METSDQTRTRATEPEKETPEAKMTNGSGKPRGETATPPKRTAKKRSRAKQATARTKGKTAAAARRPTASGEPEQMPDNELLAAALTGKVTTEGAELGHRILTAIGGMSALAAAGRKQIAEVEGSSMETAQQLRAAVEIGRRSSGPREHGVAVGTPLQAAQIASARIGNHRRKHLVALLLDEAMQPCGQRTICIGTTEPEDEATRELLWSALETRTPAVCLMANHPAADAMPSRGEMEACERVRKACALVGITLIDYVIVAGRRFYSFRQAGLVPGDTTRYLDKPPALPEHAASTAGGTPDGAPMDESGDA